MTEPLAIVIPFGVPSDGQGLGLGLAALLHTFAQCDGSSIAIAQLHARPRDETENQALSPVEAFVPPNAWKEIAGRGDAPSGAGLIITGALEPPLGGQGTIQLLAFDPRDGSTRARVDASLDAEHAGATLVGALEQLWSRIGGEIGGLQGLRDLGWEPLESVLRAERCALHDPLRGGPHDRLAAMLHLGRAIGDAPDARYPAERLATIALDAASGFALDPRLASAAMRALERATGDAPACVELVEALGALQLRLGRSRDAERSMSAAIASSPDRVRPYALLSQALRAQGSLDGALAALQAAPSKASSDPLFSVERGMVLTARGNLEGATAAWRDALSRDPVYPAAFCGLAAGIRHWQGRSSMPPWLHPPSIPTSFAAPSRLHWRSKPKGFRAPPASGASVLGCSSVCPTTRGPSSRWHKPTRSLESCPTRGSDCRRSRRWRASRRRLPRRRLSDSRSTTRPGISNCRAYCERRTSRRWTICRRYQLARVGSRRLTEHGPAGSRQPWRRGVASAGPRLVRRFTRLCKRRLVPPPCTSKWPGYFLRCATPPAPCRMQSVRWHWRANRHAR